MRSEDFIYRNVSVSNVRYGVPGAGRSTVEPRLPAEKVQGTPGCSSIRGMDSWSDFENSEIDTDGKAVTLSKMRS